MTGVTPIPSSLAGAPPVLAAARVIDEGNALDIAWLDGSRSRFHAFWLRDNSQDESTRASGSAQRLITLEQIPEDVTVDDVQFSEETLTLRFMPEEHWVSYPANWLWSHRYDRAVPGNPGRLPDGAAAWDGSFDAAQVTARFEDCATDSQQLKQWLSYVRRFGFARLSGGPVDSGALLSVVKWFGYVRHTNYGELFDVRTTVNPSNLAYTSMGLQAHTDNPYRDPVPTLQILYCMDNSAQGGDSQVVDGFQAAQRLRDEDADGFDCLTQFNARFEYRGSTGVHLTASRPMIELSVDGELRAVRFNNRSAAPITDVPYELMPRYYAAYRRFARIIDDPAMSVSFKLEPGECFIVDNTRVLHARTAYSSASGSRWLQGCYADKDGLLSTLAVLEADDTPAS